MYTLNVLLVDDEREACENLQNILSQFIDHPVNTMGFAHSTREAEEKIQELGPDAIFLDIEMPNENAFQFLERLASVNFEIIFVTAYDEYAIRAFKLNAVDYILKPINIDDLRKAIEKLKERVTYRKVIHANAHGYNELAQQINLRKKQSQIILRDNNTWEALPFSNIVYIKAMGSYSKIFYQLNGEEKNILMSRSISEYEDLLPKDIFFRIHRSYLVNCGYVQKLTKEEIPSIVLMDKSILPIGRRRFSELVLFLKNYSKRNG
ncbi:LytR/AlgR family response regulator transcription factor [Taibaiella koreensis]|uniref:LytR/AlgR family response regulator transcription factor n=1 Tax=Taibaiella koreensis TaxID=1268548 RepID=UPI000E59FDC3|nr:LytTR family DNA-binding domain-containing protein [Taibaiella koreensis]